MTDDLESAMQVLIDQDMIRVERAPSWVEVEIKTDILFPSGSAEIGADAVAILDRLAGILAERPYPIRIEGHTDNRPIKTAQFPSNWELSAARAARIVRLFEQRGITPNRMVVAGMGENQPLADNASADGRNRNRRVALVILGAPPAATRPAAGRRLPPGPRSRLQTSRHRPRCPTLPRRLPDETRRPRESDRPGQLGPAHRRPASRTRSTRRRRRTRPGPEDSSPGQDPDGRAHIIDELA